MTAKILQSGNIHLLDKLTIHYIILANYPRLLNIIYFMHTVIVLWMLVGRYQIVTLKSLCYLAEELDTRVGFSVSESRYSITTFVSMLPCLRRTNCRRSLNFVRPCIRQESSFILFIALHGLVHARSRSHFERNVVYCAERFNCAVKDLIYRRLSTLLILTCVIQSIKQHSIA